MYCSKIRVLIIILSLVNIENTECQQSKHNAVRLLDISVPEDMSVGVRIKNISRV